MLASGTVAPDFSLPTASGETITLSRLKSSVVVAFFKVSCPTCQLAFPFLEKMFRAYGPHGAKLLGVSQDPPADTAQFARTYGVGFPILYDDRERYPVSNAYKLTNVPTIFLIEEDRQISLSLVGWLRSGMETLNQEIARHTGVAPVQLIGREDAVPELKPG